MAQLPAAFLNSLHNIKGFEYDAFIAVHNAAEQITSIRINPAKKTEIKNPESKIPWTSAGFYLPERPSFTSDPLFHAGSYYVQEASSMFLEEALKQTVDLAEPLKVLDLCAAPGGKSTLIQSIISAESLLVSNEVIKTRVNVLSENIAKWGAANVIVTNNDPKDFKRLQNYFDVIVADAPCSGSGLFRKDAAAIDEWSLNNVQLCSQRQQRILADVIPSLKQNGVLIYSTCSYSTQEDEAICDWMVKEFKVESLKLKVEKSWGIIETIAENEGAYGYRFYPDKVKGEGFFIAAFRKTQNEDFLLQEKKQRNGLEKISKADIETIKPWLKNGEDYFFIKQNEEIIALPIHLQTDLAAIQSSLYIKKAGIRMGAIIRNELIPHHELAISTVISPTVASVEVDFETALQYLRKQEIKIDCKNKGWTVVKYQQLSLGWVKILPNRINNYYPKEWRILNK
jgi:NOL1/NOP2/sun family putative RNA methylase